MATIVIRSFTIVPFVGIGGFEYSVTRAYRLSTGQLYMHTDLITKERARFLIKKLGLVESYSTEDGEVYDTPDGEFKALFPKGLKNRAEREMIEHTDKI